MTQLLGWYERENAKVWVYPSEPNFLGSFPAPERGMYFEVFIAAHRYSACTPAMN